MEKKSGSGIRNKVIIAAVAAAVLLFLTVRCSETPTTPLLPRGGDAVTGITVYTFMPWQDRYLCKTLTDLEEVQRVVKILQQTSCGYAKDPGVLAGSWPLQFVLSYGDGTTDTVSLTVVDQDMFFLQGSEEQYYCGVLYDIPGFWEELNGEETELTAEEWSAVSP